MHLLIFYMIIVVQNLFMATTNETLVAIYVLTLVRYLCLKLKLINAEISDRLSHIFYLELGYSKLIPHQDVVQKNCALNTRHSISASRRSYCES